MKLEWYDPQSIADAPGVHSMGHWGPGESGWYISSSGFYINVTKTTGDDAPGPYMMNIIVQTVPNCLAAATGLCTTGADTSDAKLRSFAEHYEHKQRVAEASLLVAGGKPENHRGAVNVLAPNQRDVPNLSTYSSISSSEALPGMSSRSCPA